MILQHFGKLCHVDLYGGQHDDGDEAANSNNKNHPKSIGERLNWANISRILYIACNIRLAIDLYYQYVYDYRLARIKFYQSAAGVVSANDSTLSRLVEGLRAAEKDLSSVGAPYMNASFTSETISIFIIAIGFLLYIMTQLYFHLISPFDYSLIRAILNWQAERRALRRMIKAEVDRFLVSSSNYARVSIARLQMATTTTTTTTPTTTTNSNNGSSSRVVLANKKATTRGPTAGAFVVADGGGRRGARNEDLDRTKSLLLDMTLAVEIKTQTDILRRRHRASVRRLRLYLAEGRLIPRNRTAAWIAKVSRYYCLFTASSIVYILLATLSCLVILPIMNGFPFRTENMDILALLGLLVISIVNIASAVFYISLVMTNCLDQCKQIRDLRQQMNEFTRLNYAHKRETAARNASQHRQSTIKHPMAARRQVVLNNDFRSEPWQCHLNDHLFKIVLEYKIFVAQLRSVQSSFGFFALVSLPAALIMPIIGRVHVPYVDSNTKLYFVAVCLVCMSLYDLCLVPVCHLYSRCLDLYKSLSSLLAHVVDVVDQARAQVLVHGRRSLSSTVITYDEHLVWMIRKELNHPDQLRGQFGQAGLGLLYTYQNMVRFHFWVGLLVLSILFERSATDRELLGSIISDPLGIFR